MRNTTKILATLLVGIGMLISSIGVASASPHYSDYGGSKHNFKASSPAVTEVVQAERVTNTDQQQRNISQILTLKNAIAASFDKSPSDIWTTGGTTNIWTTGGTTNIWTTASTASLEHGPVLHDIVHCLNNAKSIASFQRGLGLHDSVHCLHNNGAFLPLHRSHFMAIR